MEMSCPLLKLLSLSPPFDRRVNTDAEQQTRDHFISDDSPACCRNWTNNTGNYLAVINWQGEEWRGNSVMDILKGVNAFSSDIKILCCSCKFRNKVKKNNNNKNLPDQFRSNLPTLMCWLKKRIIFIKTGTFIFTIGLFIVYIFIQQNDQNAGGGSQLKTNTLVANHF